MRVIEVTGEYRPCPSCKLAFKGVYPRGTTYAVIKQWWGVINVVPHKPDCVRGYLHQQAIADELEQFRAQQPPEPQEPQEETEELPAEPS